MKRFIIVTMRPNGRTIRINIDNIISYTGNEEGSTIDCLLPDYYLNVKETPEQIDEQIFPAK